MTVQTPVRCLTPTSSPVGNSYDKYATTNPLARPLVNRFCAAVDELLDLCAPLSVLDVGCGEGVLTQRWARRYAGAAILGVDREDPRCRSQWLGRREPNLSFEVADGAALRFEDSSFDLVCGIEVLEHVANPTAVLEQMRRCARKAILISVPREPLWRILNVARGTYWRDFGNTPGHLQHWSKTSLLTLLRGYGEITAVRAVTPWTVVLVQI